MAINAIILDSGALSAFARNNEIIRVAIRKATENGVNLCVPTLVIAESTTGTNRDAPVNRILKNVSVIDCTEAIARAAAALRNAVGASKAGVMDAVVVATADRRRGSTVLRGDVADLRLLSAVRGLSSIVQI